MEEPNEEEKEMLKVLLSQLCDVARGAFVAGFMKSAQGFNFEYGCSEQKLERMADEYIKDVLRTRGTH